jgi:hypothetical protein
MVSVCNLQTELLMKSIKYLFTSLIFFAFVARAQDPANIIADNEVVGKINSDYPVTLKDLKQFISDWKYQNKFRDKSDTYKNALNDLIKYRIRIFDFFDRNLQSNQDLMEGISRSINNELMKSFFDKNFADAYVNEKTAAEAYKEMDKEIICTDILLPMPADITKIKRDSLRTISLDIETGLSKNLSIKSLLKPYSPKNFKVNAQRMVRWSETMIDPVANVIKILW